MIRDCQCPRARHQHGTEQAYITDACRCDNCRAAHTARMAWRRRQYAYGRDIAHLVPAIGAARRVEALAWAGWSLQVVARRLGWDPVVIQRVRLQPRILATKHAAIAAVFDELWDKTPPTTTKTERISTSRAKAIARRRGWHPPLAWDNIDDPGEQPGPVEDTDGIDEVVVERIIAGRATAQRGPERVEAIRRLAARRLSDGEIAARIGWTRFGVSKERERRGIAAGVPSGRPVRKAAA